MAASKIVQNNKLALLIFKQKYPHIAKGPNEKINISFLIYLEFIHSLNIFYNER